MRLDKSLSGIKHANSRSSSFISVRRFCTCERERGERIPLVLLILLSGWVHPRRGLNSLDRTCWFNRKHSDATEPREKCVHVFCYRDNGRSAGVLISNPRSAALRDQDHPILPLPPSSSSPIFMPHIFPLLSYLYHHYRAILYVFLFIRINIRLGKMKIHYLCNFKL